MDRIIPFLTDEDIPVRRTAFEAMSVLEPAKAVTALRPLLDHADAGIRSPAVLWLGFLDAEQVLPKIVARVADPDPSVRGSALRALGDLGSSAQLGSMVRGLEAEERWIRQSAVIALSRLGDRRAVKSLVGLLEAEREETCDWAAVALARVGAEEAVPAIRRVLLRSASSSRAAVAWSLCRLGSRDGISAMLEYESGGLFPDFLFVPLNAFRSPGAWKRLREGRLEAPLRGTTRDVLDRIASAAGLSVEFDRGSVSPVFYLSDYRWGYRRWRVSHRGGRASLLDALEEVLGGSRYDAILEPGRLRIVPQIEAAPFWRAWWREARWQ